ncbi:hypothetical protein HOS16_gp74 [Shigella phage vB_SflS-ISF001]|uniref:Uncharacterized protein n=1 Tax=Shigella phage vB_SflS-ISF001 TaxID=2048005 RepID=A0A2D1GQ25_9CAUD|nr:hypothetical protein HOS16_gp74 [Shigella phage vB_SflS-ISF001]ATN94152.1 hypothetical protein FLXISF001_074 [Shigella phage vB_SflS-ISF001]
MKHTYKIRTKYPKFNGTTDAALNNAAAIHEKKITEPVKAVVGRFYGINADIADSKRLFKYVPGLPYGRMISIKHEKVLVRIGSLSYDEFDHKLCLLTAYQTWDGKK